MFGDFDVFSCHDVAEIVTYKISFHTVHYIKQKRERERERERGEEERD